MAGILQEADARLHRLCAEGNVDNVREYVDSFTDQDLLKARLNQSHKGVFGYTPLHEAVANGHSGVLMFLMGKGGEVDCRANSGYTPLHLAASSGHSQCVKDLLLHKASIEVRDEYGKTPIQTAELASKIAVVKLLRSEGTYVKQSCTCSCMCTHTFTS